MNCARKTLRFGIRADTGIDRREGRERQEIRVHAEFQIFLTVSWTYDETTVPTKRAKLNARMNDGGSLTVEFEDGLMGIWQSLIKQSGLRMMKKRNL